MDLRKARRKRGLTLDQVADLIGIKLMSVSRHERGASYPRPSVLEKYLVLYHGDVTEADIRETYRKARKSRPSVAPAEQETVT